MRPVAAGENTARTPGTPVTRKSGAVTGMDALRSIVSNVT